MIPDNPCNIIPSPIKEKTLIVILGPTGVGKTEISLQLAEKLKCPIISADSRQIYKGMSIATAAPTLEDRNRVPHYFVEILSPEQYYSAAQYEQDVIELLLTLFAHQNAVIMCGGSMMYIDAVCEGIDDIPTIDQQLRKDVQELYKREGAEGIRGRLKILDPAYYHQMDLKNTKRVMHALEVCLMTGKPYSSLRTGKVKQRPFKIFKLGIHRERKDLYNRINLRVDNMVEAGLIEEAKSLYHLRHLNSLNTVGYKELFDYFDGTYSLEQAIDKIKQHTRNYARKQMSWFRKDKEINWCKI